MDNETKRPFPEEENWLEKLLSTPETEEPVPDEESLSDPFFIDMQDMEDIDAPIPEGTIFLDSFLTGEDEFSELQPDEEVLASLELTHPEDMELDQIIRETKAEDFLTRETAEEPSEEEAPWKETQFFTPVSEDEQDDLPLGSLWDEEDDTASSVSDETIAVPVSEMPEWDEEYYTEDPEEEDFETDPELQEDTAISRKRRPERKKGYGLFGIPHIISTLIWLAIIVAIGVSLGRLVWVAASDMLAFNKTEVSAVIEITAEDDLDAISAKLKDAGLIRYPQLFKMFAGLKGGRDAFSNGTYSFNIPDPDKKDEFEPVIYDYNAIIKNLNTYSSSRKVVEDVMIPEGYTCAQIFALLEEKGVCTVTELEEYAANGELGEYWFLEGVKRGDKYCLEGYLFPNTYDFYVNDDPERVLRKFLNSFEDNYTEVMKEKLEPLNTRMAAILANRGYDAAYIEAHKITIREIVIVASMIEKESTGGLESYKVSSVIYNRLTNPKNFPKLQIDATIIYALNGNVDPVTGKTMPLTKADLEIDHPYNSYKYDGLPPGPISNPGATSLNAALDPDETDYYFYVYNPNAGEHIFSKTQEEHEKAVNSVRD